MKLKNLLALTLIMVCFAANSIITRYLVVEKLVSPFLLTVIRFLSGLLMLQALCSLWPGTFTKKKLNRSYLWGALFLGVYAFSISYGYLFISAAAGVLIFYTSVVITMSLFSLLEEKERLTPGLVLGQLLGMLGVLVITFSGIKSVTLEGAALMMFTGIAWGLYSVYGKNFTSPFCYTFNTFLILGAGSTLLSLIVYFAFPHQIKISLFQALGWALFLGMISTALSYALWHRVMQQIKASQGGVAQLLVPVLTALMGVFILGEEINVSLIIGGTLIIIGIALNIV